MTFKKYSYHSAKQRLCLSLKKMLIESGWQEGKLPRIIAKIESRQGLLNLLNCCVSDAILVDRGDLSREIKISLILL